MKVLKPLTLSVLTRPFEARGERRLGVHVIAMVPLLGPPRLCTEQELWEAVPRALGEGAVLEEGIPKSRAEVLLAGRAHAPGGRAKTCPVQWSLGGLARRASVLGDRRWVEGVPTDPEPFESMPLTWERAFGGPGFDANPLGRGYPGPDGAAPPRLPNIEHPDRLIRAPTDRPDPVGFGPIDVRWPTRARHRGTYDQAWFDTRYPGFADDLDWRHWNLADPSQQQEAPFVGDEAYVLRNLHPTHAEIRGQLPGVRARAFIVRGAPIGEAELGGPLEEVGTRLMTVWLLPEEERAVLVYSGVVSVEEPDGRDVRLLLVAAETDAREKEHYETVRARRLDKDRAAIEALVDRDLVPEPLLEGVRLTNEAEPSPLARNMQRAREASLERARARAAELDTDLEALGADFGLDPVATSLPDLRDLPAYLEQAQKQLDDTKRDMEANAARQREELRATAAAAGVELDGLFDAPSAPTGPPPFTAEGERRRLEELVAASEAAGVPQPALRARLDDPAQHAMWQRDERRMRDLYRVGAHEQTPTPRREAQASLRQELEQAAREGAPARERDLTGASLEAASLRGLDLSGCLLESADLRGADLREACLDGAVLAHADLTGARLERADLTGANLGRAQLRGARLDEANLSGATLSHADFEGARLLGATLSESWLLETRFEAADLSGASGRAMFWVRVDLSEARLVGARLEKSTFVECQLDDADASDAHLAEANFVTCSFERARLARARAEGMRWVHGARARGADLRFAALVGANLRGAELSGADLSGATLDGADLSEAQLDACQLFGCRARGARFMRASLRHATLLRSDLMEASLLQADLRGADLRDSNLYGADLALVQGDDETRFDGANRDRMRAHPRRRSS